MSAPPPGPTEDVFSTVPPTEPIWPPRLVQSPGWFGGLEGYAGILHLGASDTREAYAFGGGQLRLRYDYYELGAYFEVSDHPDDQTDDFRAFGGFLGAWLPFRGWVDFEIAAGVGGRNYQSDDPRYQGGGYDVSSPTASLRLGVSDRTSSYSAVAARVGGQIVFTYDFNPADEPWSQTIESGGGEDPVTERGTTRVGGYTIALALVLGFDIGKAIKPSPVASAKVE
jgi:hypothetical protein